MKNVAEYYMSDVELRRLQLTQLDLIGEVDRICKKCNIKYNMVGGTMLGAIRHKGYIPWDDDADIGFLREEYEKFREACKTELNKDKYYFQDLRDTKGYRWGYGKLRRKNTKFVRLDQEDMPFEKGISIDLMPFDNIPDEYLNRKVHKFCCFIYRKIFWSVIGRNSEKNAIKRILYKVLYCIPEKYVKESYEKFVNRMKRKETALVRILTFPTPKHVDGYDRKWYTDLNEYTFEELKLPGAADFDGYLKVKFDNYMELPQEAKRKTHPISELKLPEE